MGWHLRCSGKSGEFARPQQFGSSPLHSRHALLSTCMRPPSHVISCNFLKSSQVPDHVALPVRPLCGGTASRRRLRGPWGSGVFSRRSASTFVNASSRRGSSTIAAPCLRCFLPCSKVAPRRACTAVSPSPLKGSQHHWSSRVQGVFPYRSEVVPAPVFHSHQRPLPTGAVAVLH